MNTKRFRCIIKCDDAALHENPEALARLLRKIASDIEADPETPTYRTARDENGNDVGRYRYTYEDKDGENRYTEQG